MALRVSLLFYFINALLVSANLPNGLYSAKEIGLYFVTALVALIAIIQIWVNRRKIKVTIQPIDLLVLLYLCIVPCLHEFIFSNDVQDAEIRIHVAFGVSYLSIRLLCIPSDRSTIIKAVGDTITTVLIFQILIFAAQYTNLMPSYYPTVGPTGMFSNPGPFAIFTASLVVFTTITQFTKFSKGEGNVIGIEPYLVFLGVWIVVLSFSRSAWIGFVLAGGIAIYRLFAVQFTTWFRASRKRALIFFVMVGLLLIPVGLWMYNIKPYSASGRILIWLSTLEMVKETWLIGVGIGNFAPKYIHFQADFLNSSPARLASFGSLAGDTRYAFNDLLQIISEKGIFGLALFISIVGYTLRSLWRGSKRIFVEDRSFACSLMGAVIVILVSGLTAYPLQVIPIALSFWVIVAITASSFGYQYQGVLNRPISNWFVIVALCGGVFGLGYYGYIRTSAYLYWMKHKSQNLGLKELRNAAIGFGILDDKAEFLYYCSQLHAATGEYQISSELLERAVQLNPAPLFYYHLGHAYEKTGHFDKALENYQMIRRSIPNLMRPRYLEAVLYRNRGDTTLFLKKAREALDFKPKIENYEVRNMRNELNTSIQNINREKYRY